MPGAGGALGGGQPGGVEIGGEHLLQHVPVLRVSPDARLEKARDLLGHRRRLLPGVSFGGHADLLMDVHAPAIALEPQDRGHQRRAGLHGQRGRAAHHPGLLAEELHLDAAAGDIAVTDQADNLAGPQPLGQDGEPLRPAAGRQHLHAEPLAERDEPVIDRLRLHPLDHGGNRARPLATIHAQARS